MLNFDIYKQITERTNGDIYVGVVGPVRTGKSTFITKFMNTIVLPNIVDENVKKRATDELPQMGAGKTIMTMQPNFVPNDSVKVTFDKNITANVRLVDCVGYLIDGVQGHMEDNAPRLVKTPWQENKITLKEAAEIGTTKVIRDHSTIGILITTDGTITDLPRKNYVDAEERVVKELKAINKPFIVLLNSKDPYSDKTEKLRLAMEKKYDVEVVTLDIDKMTKQEALSVLEKVLYEFPVKRINIDIPEWMNTLDGENALIKTILTDVSSIDVKYMKDCKKMCSLFEGNADFQSPELKCLDLGNGEITYSIDASRELYYRTISEITGEKIDSEFSLFNYIKLLAHAKKEYDKLSQALEQVDNTGYGIVVPSIEDMEYSEPEVIKRGSNNGIKLRAKGSSLHIMKVDVTSEVSPAVGIELNNDTMENLLGSMSENTDSLWNTKMFGKSLTELAHDGIVTKLQTIPEEAQVKLRRTITKITNEGKGGIICILL